MPDVILPFSLRNMPDHNYKADTLITFTVQLQGVTVSETKTVADWTGFYAPSEVSCDVLEDAFEVYLEDWTSETVASGWRVKEGCEDA